MIESLDLLRLHDEPPDFEDFPDELFLHEPDEDFFPLEGWFSLPSSLFLDDDDFLHDPEDLEDLAPSEWIDFFDDDFLQVEPPPSEWIDFFDDDFLQVEPPLDLAALLLQVFFGSGTPEQEKSQLVILVV